MKSTKKSNYDFFASIRKDECESVDYIIKRKRKEFRDEFFEYIGWHKDEEWFLDEQ